MTNGATTDTQPKINSIYGLSVLKGLLLYALILTFAGLYVYFIWKISGAGGKGPTFDATLVTAAAALAGVLGSAFALYIGSPTDESAVNPALAKRLKDDAQRGKPLTIFHTILSLDPGATDASSVPRTVGIWVYAVVASAVTVTYVLNQNQTPSAIKGLAVAFGGYLIALLTNAYKQQQAG